MFARISSINEWRTGNNELTCYESDCQVEHDDVGGGCADRDAEGGKDGTDDGDHTTAVPVHHGAGDRAHTQRHAHQDGGYERDWSTAFTENIHEFDQIRSERVGDAISCKNESKLMRLPKYYSVKWPILSILASAFVKKTS